ncbi:spore photoproduct lyase family protein [Methylobacterium trifolii]|uniref:spore photoproduct lyase family protein n=1 Tax=Methylobacterium trifolii TaxID=1003092 RepID=UPI0035A25248
MASRTVVPSPSGQRPSVPRSSRWRGIGSLFRRRTTRAPPPGGRGDPRRRRRLTASASPWRRSNPSAIDGGPSPILLARTAEALSGRIELDLTAELIAHRSTPGSKSVPQGWYPGSDLDLDEATRSRKPTKVGSTRYVDPPVSDGPPPARARSRSTAWRTTSCTGPGYAGAITPSTPMDRPATEAESIEFQIIASRFDATRSHEPST